MGINVSLANSQANKISEYESTLREIKGSLNNFKVYLNSAWQAQEMIYINNAIDSINREITSLSSSLDSLSSDIIRTANEIRREEEAREAARAAAAARAAIGR
jgi:uncharacterized protein YukE